MKLVWILCLFALTVPLQAQGPAAEWRTLETPSFRIHYPKASEAWALHLADRLEAIHERVAREVGFDRPEVVDVLVLDPVARPNGSAWPVLGRPRMLLYSSPPESDSILGNYRNWGELVAVHEEVHLAHLLRPSRNPFRRVIESLIPIGPIAQRSPRWVIEGYATYLEGELTGRGRPFSHLRATILRRWAQQGEIPGYYQLSANDRDWLGMSMAYLVGSAYLQWLVDSFGEESLRDLWQRLSAVRNRSFSEAFSGVFGDSPEKLYNRFRAELTYEAIRLELEDPKTSSEGELWQDLRWTSGQPAVSPDGELLALVLRSRKDPQRLVVWETGDDGAARERRKADIEALLAADPLDVPATDSASRPLPRQSVHELKARLGAGFSSPRFLPDGHSLLHVRFEPDGEGFLHPDLFVWSFETGAVERLTRGADVRDVDPAPSGEWAVAVRNRHGASQLVTIDLTTSRVEPLTEPSIHTVFDQPRISPDGRRLVCVRHSEGRWHLVLWNLEGRRLRRSEPESLPLAPGSTITHPSWSPDGTEIYASIGEKGNLHLVAFDLASGTSRILSRGQNGQLAPEPTPDGKRLFFLSLDSEGLDLRTLDLHRQDLPEQDFETPKGPSIASLRSMLEPVAPENPPLGDPGTRTPDPGERAHPRSYGIGRLEVFPLLSGSWSPSRRAAEAGIRLGDVLGRTEILALGVDGATETGGAARMTWRGWPWAVSGHLFRARERPSRQSRIVPGLGEYLDLESSGVELTISRSFLARGYRIGLVGGGSLGTIETAGSNPQRFDRSFLFVRPSLVLRQQLGPSWTLSEEAHLALASGRTEEDSWNRWLATVRVSTRAPSGTLQLAWIRGESKSAEFLFDRFLVGGLSGSILPRSVVGNRIEVPALPVATRIGDEYEGQSLSLWPKRLPVRLFLERHRIPGEASGRQWLALRGAELRLAGRARPLLRLPAYELRLGAAEILDEPFAGEINWWIGLSFRPRDR